MLIEAKDIVKHFPVGRSLFGTATKYVHAVESVNLAIPQGQTLALVGESGSGKTTLGRICAGLLEPTTGKLFFEDIDLYKTSPLERRKIRRKLQFVFQDPYSSLNPRHNVRNILARPFEIHTNLTQKEIDDKVEILLGSVGLNPARSFMHRYPHQFSGGQRQRIVFARAIALEPKFIVADEPVSSLDMSVKAQLLTLLRRFQEELDLTYLFITHELAVVRSVAKNIAVMYLGKLVEYGSVLEFFNGPLHPYSYALLAATPVLNPHEARTRERISLPGTMPSPINPPSGCYFHTRCPFAQPICQEKEPELREIGQRRVACHFVGQPDFPLTANLSLEQKPEALKKAESFPRAGVAAG